MLEATLELETAGCCGCGCAGDCRCGVELIPMSAAAEYEPRRPAPVALADAATQARRRATAMWEQLI